jgi:hypothetical protein
MTRINTGIQDRILISMIFLMTLGSGYTTVMGAKEIFPTEGTGILVGIGAQVTLFLLLTNLVLKNAPFRKWFVSSILVAFSIYTSYFSYYDTIARDDNSQKVYDKAVVAHQVVKSTFYIPLKVKLENTINERNNVVYQEKKEVEGEGSTQVKGIGSQSKRYASESIRLDSEIAKLKVIESIKDLFEYDTKGLKPEDILDKDRKAVAAIPTDLLPKSYNESNIQSFIKRDDYIEEASNIKFLLPYQRLIQGDRVAQISFFIACMVDGAMILLSTAVDTTGKSSFRRTAMALSHTITDFKSLIATIIVAFEKEPVPHDSTGFETDALDQGVDYVSIQLQGKGTEFLEFFVESIDPYTLIINRSALSKHSEPTFRTSYSILLNALSSTQKQWCKLENGDFLVQEKHRDVFFKWMAEEIIVQARYEESLRNYTVFSHTIRNVRLKIPSLP